jgi:hypothetical protein
MRCLVLALSVLFHASLTPTSARTADDVRPSADPQQAAAEQPGHQAAFDDVSALKIGAPVSIAELDLGKLKGDLRRLSWSPDDDWLYVQTAEGSDDSLKLHHYSLALEVGTVRGLDAEPDWAAQYWAFKSDRSAPGLASLLIEVEQKIETIKAGTGPAGALDRTSDPRGGNNAMDPENIAKGTDQYQRANVVRLKLLDETISEFVNQRPIPGLTFSWGPEKSGAIAYTDRDGRVILFDQHKHRQTASAAKDATLPAWTMDGTRLAWAHKSARRKYTLFYATITR